VALVKYIQKIVNGGITQEDFSPERSHGDLLKKIYEDFSINRYLYAEYKMLYTLISLTYMNFDTLNELKSRSNLDFNIQNFDLFFAYAYFLLFYTNDHKDIRIDSELYNKLEEFIRIDSYFQKLNIDSLQRN